MRAFCLIAVMVTVAACLVVFSPAARASDADQTSKMTFSRPALVRLIRQELWRTGCLLVADNTSGWGKAERAAATRFLLIQGEQAGANQPNVRLFMLLAHAPSNICESAPDGRSSACFTYKGDEYCE